MKFSLVRKSILFFSVFMLFFIAFFESRELFPVLHDGKYHYLFLILLFPILVIPSIFLFKRFFLRNIDYIYTAVSKAVDGDLNVRAEIKSKDEIGELAMIFNKMMNGLKKRSDYVRMLRDVAISANEENTIEKIFQTVIDKICFYKSWPIGHAYILSPENSDILISSDIWHFEDSEKFKTFREITEKTALTKGKGLPGRIWESGSPIWIGNVQKDPNFPRAQMVADIGVKSSFGFPIIFDNKVIAVLEFFTEEEETEEKEELLAVVKNIGFQVGKVLERIDVANQLKIRLEDLEKFRKVTLGRELRMAELKKEIEDLRKQLGEKD